MKDRSLGRLIDPDPISIALGIIGAIGSIGWVYDKVQDSHDRKKAKRQAQREARSTVRNIRNECRQLSECCEDLVLILKEATSDDVSAINRLFRLGETKLYLPPKQLSELVSIATKVGGSFAKLHNHIRSLLSTHPEVAQEAHIRLTALDVDVARALNEIMSGNLTNDEAFTRLIQLLRKIEDVFDFSELDEHNF